MDAAACSGRQHYLLPKPGTNATGLIYVKVSPLKISKFFHESLSLSSWEGSENLLGIFGFFSLCIVILNVSVCRWPTYSQIESAPEVDKSVPRISPLA